MNKEFWAEHYPDNIDWTIMGFTADELRAMDSQPERLTYRTLAPQVTEGFWKSKQFDSSKFAKAGEKFCYVKSRLTYEEGHDPQFEDFQEQLDKELREAGIGCQIGAGRGSEYYFFDLALKDIDAAVEFMKKLALTIDLPKQTWLMFYDATDKAKSIELHTEAPAGV